MQYGLYRAPLEGTFQASSVGSHSREALEVSSKDRTDSRSTKRGVVGGWVYLVRKTKLSRRGKRMNHPLTEASTIWRPSSHPVLSSRSVRLSIPTIEDKIQTSATITCFYRSRLSDPPPPPLRSAEILALQAACL